MYSKSKKISLSDLKLVSGGTIVSSEPLKIERNDVEHLVFELMSEGSFEWTEDNYIIVDFMGEADAKIYMDITFCYGEDEKLTADRFFIPNRRVKMPVKLDELKSARWFLPPVPGSLKGHLVGLPCHISQIEKVQFTFYSGRDDKSVTIYDISISDKLPDMKVSGEPMVDKFGQRTDAEWNGKVHSEEELVKLLKKEYEWAKNNNRYLRDDLSKYGGWTKKKFEATGFFHKKHDEKRWWLVDPDGYAFFSNGICYGCRMGTFALVHRIENLFEWLPDKSDETFKPAWTTASEIPEFAKRNGKDAGKDWDMFNFARANMIRAFGENWWDAFLTINGARLKQWGFNTVGVNVNNYQDENVWEFVEKLKMPFTFALLNFPKTKKMVFRDFPDVCSPEYEENSKKFAEQLRPFKDNPYMIGYFMTNEPEWSVVKNVNIARILLDCDNSLYSKQELIEFLKNKYKNIENLNSSWNTAFTSFETLGSAGVKDNDDLNEFNVAIIKKYIQTPVDALRAVDKNHLNLGNRYAGTPGYGYCDADNIYDIFSANGYRREPDEFCDTLAKTFENPLFIGEWMFGGSDRSHISNALINASNQYERGKACANYMQHTMAHKHCVGIHYFELNDEPVLGTYDGQNMPHGFVNVCNMPYTVCVNEFVKISKNMYEYIDGQIKPEHISWEYRARF